MQTKSKKDSRNAHNIFMRIFHRILEYFHKFYKFSRIITLLLFYPERQLRDRLATIISRRKQQ